ncbi:MAG: hypothetical protein KDB16_20160, partial [Acidimicrobiales bacterium]|nr:hypothetical protein [Acidimicrobiales bacterium]
MSTITYADGVVTLIDQTRLPHDEVYLSIGDVATLVDAIKRLAVRGAPAIGVAGAYGVVLAAKQHHPRHDPDGFEAAVRSLRNARPTAVNLARMVDRVAAVARQDPSGAEAEANAVRAEELAA